MEFNILIGEFVKESDKETLFGPLTEWDKFVKMDSNTRFPQLMRTLGIFPSASQAVRCGWDKDIPEGWSEWPMGSGSKHKKLFIWKVTQWNPEWGEFSK